MLVDLHQQQVILELPILVVVEVVDSTLVLQLMVDLVSLLSICCLINNQRIAIILM